MKKKHYSHLYFPALLLFLCLCVYGAFAPFLGFYWDDLPYTYFEIAKGIQGTMKAIALDRPVLSIFYAFPMALFGEKPLVWQVFGLFSRWLFTLSIFGFLQSFWPKREKANQAITILLLVFPGFTQQWISVIYSHAFLVLALYFLSLTIFTNNLQKDKPCIIMTIYSILLGLICMAAMEYVIGLEFSRLVMVYLIQKRKSKHATFKDLVVDSFLLWLPYLAVLIIFIIYRIFFASSVLYSVQNMSGFLTSPARTFLDIIGSQLSNVYTSIIPVWGKIFSPFFSIDFTSTYGKIHLLFMGFLVVMAVVFIFLQNKNLLSKQSFPATGLIWVKEAIPLSLCMLFFSGLPFWTANLVPGIGFPNDRFLLPFMLGSTLIVFSFLELTRMRKWIWTFLFCVLFSLSGASQLFNANNFRNEWDRFTSFFQQLTWRIPSIAENTIFVAEDLPFTYYSDNSLSAALNWLYAVNPINHSLPYLINYTDNRLGTSLPSLNAGTTILHNYRIFTFNGNTDDMVILYHQPPGCVHIADPSLDPLNPLMPPILREASGRSNTSTIKQLKSRHSVFFVKETQPNNSWCYFYQKASLAYQYQNWEEIARLGDLAFALDDYPNDASERFPFIVGYALSGNLDTAIDLSQTVHQISVLYDPMLCEAWKLIEEETPGVAQSQDSLPVLINQLNCDQ